MILKFCVLFGVTFSVALIIALMLYSYAKDKSFHKLEQLFYGFLMLHGFIAGHVIHMVVQGYLTGQKVAVKRLEEEVDEYVADEHSMGIL